MLIEVQMMDIILLLLSEQQQRCDFFFHTSYFSVDSGAICGNSFDTDTNISYLIIISHMST